MDGKADIERRLVQIDSILTSPAWKLMDSKMAESEAYTYTSLVAASSPHEMAKLAGAHHAIRQLRTWPERERRALQDHLAQLLDEDRREVEERRGVADLRY